jgi:hypothetical protein
MNFKPLALIALSFIGFTATAEKNCNTDQCLDDSQPIKQPVHHEDPTKIITKMGVGFNENFTLSGSIGLDAVRKINASINDDASSWKLGGSWLFEKGIVNANLRRSELDLGTSKTGYSLGTVIPLRAFDFTPYDIQIFPMVGISKNEGDIAIKNTEPTLGNDYVLVSNSTKGAYIGYFAFKTLSAKWSVLSFGGTSKGSDDYSGYWFGGGLSYKIDQQQSINGYGFMTDDDFGSQEKIGFTYRYEFEDIFVSD